FDPRKASTLGLRPRLAQALLVGLVTLAIVASFHVVGTLLVFGLLVAPPAAMALWARRIPMIMAGAALLGIVAAVLGLLLSWHLGTAAGATIAAVAVAEFFVSALAYRVARWGGGAARWPPWSRPPGAAPAARDPRLPGRWPWPSSSSRRWRTGWPGEAVGRGAGRADRARRVRPRRRGTAAARVRGRGRGDGRAAAPAGAGGRLRRVRARPDHRRRDRGRAARGDHRGRRGRAVRVRRARRGGAARRRQRGVDRRPRGPRALLPRRAPGPRLGGRAAGALR